LEYGTGDAVSYDRQAYIAIAETSGLEVPTDEAFRDLLAGRGEAGTAGADGETGPVGPRGSQGAEGATGPAGPQGIAHPSDISIDTTTGFDISGGASTLNCNGWTTTTGHGLTVNGSNLSINQYASCANSQPVLCSIIDGTEEVYEFAGFTTATMSGSAGYLGMNNACRNDFGSDARMATSTEVAQSNLGAAQSGVAWVQGVSHASDPSLDAVSGTSTGSLTCKGWSDSGSITALTVDGANFSMGTQFCYQASAVACSVPR